MQLKLHKQACWESHALVAVTVQLMCVSWSHYLQKTPVYLRQKSLWRIRPKGMHIEPWS